MNGEADHGSGHDKRLAPGGLGVADRPSDAGFFESAYARAAGDIGVVPWAKGKPNPLLVTWLNAIAPGMTRPGCRVAVVGCGLGDDVAELAARGYDAVGFDISPTAIDWARGRFPHLADCFVVGDVFDPPARYVHRFDLVVEIYTLQSLPVAAREAAAGALTALATPHGAILAIAQGRDAASPLDEASGPPWPLSRDELVGAFGRCGWSPLGGVSEFEDDGDPPVRRLRGVFSRG